MSAKTIAAPLLPFTQAPPLVRHLRGAIHWLVQRFTRTASTAERVLAVEDRVAIGPKKSLVVVRCHGQRFLIATAGDTIGPVIEVAPPSSSPRSVRRPRKEPAA